MSLKFNKTTVEEILESRGNMNVAQLIQQRCTEYYNEGVDACIEEVEKHKGFSAATDAVLESIVFRLIILKKN